MKLPMPRYNGVAVRICGLTALYRLTSPIPEFRKRHPRHHEVVHAAYTTTTGQLRLKRIWDIAELYADDQDVRLMAATYNNKTGDTQ